VNDAHAERISDAIAASACRRMGDDESRP